MALRGKLLLNFLSIKVVADERKRFIDGLSEDDRCFGQVVFVLLLLVLLWHSVFHSLFPFLKAFSLQKKGIWCVIICPHFVGFFLISSCSFGLRKRKKKKKKKRSPAAAVHVYTHP